MSILAGVLSSRFFQPQPGVMARSGQPSWEARARFMESLGYTPIEAIAAAKAGQMRGPMGPDMEALARRRREEAIAGKERDAEMKRFDENVRRERGLAALGVPFMGGDKDEADIVGLIRAGHAKPMDLLKFRQSKADKQAQARERTVGGIGSRIGQGVSRIGEFIENIRGGAQRLAERGQTIAATQERRQHEEMDRELAAAEKHEALAKAWIATGASPELAETMATIGKMPSLRTARPEPSMTPEEAVAEVGKLLMYQRAELRQALLRKRMTGELNPTEQVIWDDLERRAVPPPEETGGSWFGLGK